MTQRLPKKLLARIGEIVVVTAYIEQELLLSASALAALETDGRPVEHLRFEFRRLRETWYRLNKKHYGDTQVFKKFTHPLNSKLPRLWRFRGFMIHGRWSRAGGNKFRMDCWEQTDTLRRYRRDFTIEEIQSFLESLQIILAQIYWVQDTGKPPPSPKKLRQLLRPTNSNYRASSAKL